MGNIFRQNLRDSIEACVKKATNASLVEHSGLAGEIRELLISNILNDILPQGFKIGTGKVSDSSGNLSSQCDIIIYNNAVFPPVLFSEKKGIFPIESVAYIIEVKTTLNATELKTTQKKYDKIKKELTCDLPYVLFAFNSDLSNRDADWKRIKKHIEKHDRDSINIFCIVDRLYAFLSNGKWEAYPTDSDFSETISLIIGILNTLMNWNQKRYVTVPGEYFGKK